MARISLIEEADHPELAPLIDRIKAGRRGGLLNVYKLLLHAPALAETWLDHVGAVRWKTALSGRLRELLVIRIAHVNGIDYVINQHVPALALADGVTLAECDLLEGGAAKPPPGREKRDRFEQVGLAGAVRADQHHRAVADRQRCGVIAAEIREGQAADAGGIRHRP